MENTDITGLIKRGYSLIDDLDYFPHKGESSINLTDKINDWAESSMNILKTIGKDRDEIKIISISSPVAGLFDFEKLDNKKTLEKNKQIIKDYIILVLNNLAENKKQQNKENTIFYCEDEIYVERKSGTKSYKPRLIENKISKRMNLILLLIKADKILSPKSIATKISYQDGSEVQKEVKDINSLSREKLGIKSDLIVHHKTLGYTANKSKYFFIKKSTT